MRSSCIDEQYCRIIGETATFLARVEELDLSRSLYDSYTEAIRAITSSQEQRMETARKDKVKEEKRARREGTDQHQVVTLGVEKDVDVMLWAQLPDALHAFFSFLPAS